MPISGTGSVDSNNNVSVNAGEYLNISVGTYAFYSFGTSGSLNFVQNASASITGIFGGMVNSGGTLSVLSGADPNNPDVINEANQLYLMMDGLAQKKTQFTLAGFSTFGGGGGTSSTRHPGWYPIMYLLLATVLWLIGLILIIRRGRRTQHRSE